MSERINVYHFVRPAPDELAAYRLLRDLEAAGFDARLTCHGGESTISLPAAQVGWLRSVQCIDPDTFGGC